MCYNSLQISSLHLFVASSSCCPIFINDVGRYLRSYNDLRQQDLPVSNHTDIPQTPTYLDLWRALKKAKKQPRSHSYFTIINFIYHTFSDNCIRFKPKYSNMGEPGFHSFVGAIFLEPFTPIFSFKNKRVGLLLLSAVSFAEANILFNVHKHTKWSADSFSPVSLRGSKTVLQIGCLAQKMNLERQITLSLLIEGWARFSTGWLR